MIQSVIVKKSHPDVRNRADAERVARNYGARSTENMKDPANGKAYHFRQVEPGLLDPRSFKTDIINEHISITKAELKR